MDELLASASYPDILAVKRAIENLPRSTLLSGILELIRQEEIKRTKAHLLRVEQIVNEWPDWMKNCLGRIPTGD